MVAAAAVVLVAAVVVAAAAAVLWLLLCLARAIYILGKCRVQQAASDTAHAERSGAELAARSARAARGRV
jgi:hypothetical protein